MSFQHQCIAILLCAMALQGCGNSPPTDASSALVLEDDSSGQASEYSYTGTPAVGGDVTGNQLYTEDSTLVEIIGPEGDSGLNYNGMFYPLDSALGDIWGVVNEHYNVNFTVSNGRYRIEQVETGGTVYDLLLPAAASAIIHAEMYSPGEQFSMLTYSFSPFGDGGGVLAGNAFFSNAYVGVDEDLSGDVEEDEKQAVTGGTIEFTGSLPHIELRFSLTLEDGQLVEGHYSGLFNFTER